MTNPLDDQLRQITLEAFESLCQIFPLTHTETEDGLPLEGAVSVDFTGPVQGTFTLGFHGRLRRVVAEAMLGGNPSAQEEEDAMKEMANVLCGNILPFVGGPEPIFKLNAPRVEALLVKKTPPLAHASIVFPEGAAQMEIFLL